MFESNNNFWFFSNTTVDTGSKESDFSYPTTPILSNPFSEDNGTPLSQFLPPKIDNTCGEIKIEPVKKNLTILNFNEEHDASTVGSVCIDTCKSQDLKRFSASQFEDDTDSVIANHNFEQQKVAPEQDDEYDSDLIIKITLEEPEEEQPIKLEKPKKKWSKHREKFTRWGKEEDREMFRTLKSIWRHKGIDIPTFYAEDLHIKLQKYEDLLSTLVHQIKWRGTPELLMRRIHKCTQKGKISVREGKSIRQIVQKQKMNGIFDIEALSYYCPGRTNETLLQFLNKPVSK